MAWKCSSCGGGMGKGGVHICPPMRSAFAKNFGGTHHQSTRNYRGTNQTHHTVRDLEGDPSGQSRVSWNQHANGDISYIHVPEKGKK